MNFWPFNRKANEDGSARHSLDLFRLLYGSLRSKSGASVSHQTALQVTTVLACARVIAEGVAQVPLKVHKKVGENMVSGDDLALYDVLYRKPNDWMTSFELREMMTMHCVLTGSAFAFINRIGGEVRELIPIVPNLVSVKQNEDYSLRYEVTSPSGKVLPIPAESIWHWRGASWDGIVGLDITRLACEAIGLAMATEDSQARMQKNGSSFGGTYSVSGTLNPDQYAAMRKWLDKEFDGLENLGRPRIMDRDAKFTPSTMTGIDAQLLETRNNQVVEICRAMRVMPIMVGHSDKTATYASAEQMFLAHVVHTLSPWYVRIEQSAECQLLTDRQRRNGYFIKFNASGLMRGSHKDRAEYFSRALGSGGSPAWMSQDEVRALDELNPMGGDAAQLPKQLGSNTTQEVKV